MPRRLSTDKNLKELSKRKPERRRNKRMRKWLGLVLISSFLNQKKRTLTSKILSSKLDKNRMQARKKSKLIKHRSQSTLFQRPTKSSLTVMKSLFSHFASIVTEQRWYPVVWTIEWRFGTLLLWIVTWSPSRTLNHLMDIQCGHYRLIRVELIFYVAVETTKLKFTTLKVSEKRQPSGETCTSLTWHIRRAT